MENQILSKITEMVAGSMQKRKLLVREGNEFRSRIEGVRKDSEKLKLRFALLSHQYEKDTAEAEALSTTVSHLQRSLAEVRAQFSMRTEEMQREDEKLILLRNDLLGQVTKSASELQLQREFVQRKRHDLKTRVAGL